MEFDEPVPPGLSLQVFIFILFACVVVLPACMSVHYMHAWYLQKPEKATDLPELELQVIVRYNVGTETQTQIR